MGKLSDKFLNTFSLNDDDEEGEDYEDEIDEEYENDQQPDENKSTVFSKSKKEEDKQSKPFGKRVTSINRNSENQEVCVIKPSTIDDSREISETLLSGKAVIINFEGLHVEISQRIMDFVSGTCYAIDGNLQKISSYIFIATPNSVEISGDFQDLFDESDNSFDISGFKSPLI